MRNFQKRTKTLVVCAITVLFSQAVSAQGTDIPTSIDKKEFNPATLMWYTTPVEKWEDALPIGNGRLGALIWGGVDEEVINLNEDTYYSGGPYSTVKEGGYKALPEIQKLLFAGEPIKAHKMFSRNILGYPVEQMKYQSMGGLHIFYGEDLKATNYKRWLDLSRGITGSNYEIDGVTYTREILSSHVDQTIAIRLTASKPGMISFEAELQGTRNGSHSNYGTDYFRMDGENENELVLRGRSADYLGIESKLLYEERARFANEGGKVSLDDSRIKIENADAVTIYIVAATNFVNYKDVSADQAQRAKDYMNGVKGKSFDDVKSAALKDYQSFFNRVDLSLGNSESSYLPTNERMASIQTKPDPSMAALSYQFGRYLLISSSRPGTQPANLQGIWNPEVNPAWDSKYTTNINTEMNYWATESSNLSELHEPLFKMIEELTDEGTKVAKEHYGAKGWVFHQNTDLWRVAAPMDGSQWGTFTVGGAWLTTHMWERYLFSQDEEFLKRAYPTMKGCVDFFMDFLIEHPNGKWLVTSPSNSPENPPAGPGYKYFFDEVIAWEYFTTIVYGSTIDMQILKDLFKYYVEASDILGLDKEYAKKVNAARDRLVPSMVGKDGTLQEWTEDYAQMEKNHRHYSHMYGLYPGNVLSAKRTPELVDPIKKVMDLRGDESTGWSRAWKMSIWARLYDGERSLRIYKGYLKDVCTESFFAICTGSMQVDGSHGVTAGVTEMLVQSHEGVIDLLPAVPNEWGTGQFDGVCVRGGFELDIKWKDSKITSVEVLSKAGSACVINTKGKTKVTLDGKEIKTKSNKDGSIEFETIKGKTYQITAL
ncbi:MAG: glycoside hydrolase family 95 protein [Flavobacteriales bacterium]|nr:glycoside hydrolase family 95 protein [Flavobacteriales bacterium]